VILSGKGDLTIGPGASLELAGSPNIGPTLGTPVIIDNKAVATVAGGETVTLGGRMTNNGTLTLESSGGPSAIACPGAGDITNYGTIDVSRGSDITPSSCVVNKGGGKVSAQAKAAIARAWGQLGGAAAYATTLAEDAWFCGCSPRGR
jgi:hypothetical protein